MEGGTLEPNTNQLLVLTITNTYTHLHVQSMRKAEQLQKMET